MKQVIPKRESYHVKHKWKSHKNPNTATEFGEWVVYCDVCGTEQDDDNKDEQCA
jgi:rubrerythrin